MKFYNDKCEVMPGKNPDNSNFIKWMRSSELAITTQEQNLRGIVNSSIIISFQCLAVVKIKTSKKWAIILKEQERKQKDAVMP